VKKIVQAPIIKQGIAMCLCLCICLCNINCGTGGGAKLYDVRDYGATGKKEQNARTAIQKTIDACAAHGGGIVYLPPGDYTSGTIYLKSHVRFRLEAGATLYSIKDSTQFDKPTLIYGDSLQDISIEGRGTVDGEAAYEWKLNFIHDDLIRAQLEAEEAVGKPLMRSFPKTNQYGHLIFLLNCKNVRIEGISLLHSPSWTLYPVHCQQLVIDGINIYTDPKLAVWADGIDPDGCQHVRISNCNIETGDDALVFYSMPWYGPAQPDDDITVTNCRFTSASSGIKFCDCNVDAIRHVTIDNCTIQGSNRGIAFMNYDGGVVEDVILSNLIINCIRYDWYWWGEGDPIYFDVRKSRELSKTHEPLGDVPAGKIKHVLITNVIATGKGSSICHGHPESWLEDITLDNVKLYISHDTTSDYDNGIYALKFQYVKNLTLRNVDLYWGTPASAKWTSALGLQDIDGLNLDNISARQAQLGTATAAITLSRVQNATIRNSSPQTGTETFMNFTGTTTSNILIYSNDFSNAKTAYTTDGTFGAGVIRSELNVNPKP
jgi:hypothetical protein